jgi:two-component system, chemotaxis family, sensor kinase CheA
MAEDLDWFALFLALGETRLDEARAALGIGDEGGAADPARARAALVPLAVDAALLGAEGVSALALALAEHAKDAPERDVIEAIARLSAAVEALGHADASGARTDENVLMEAARELAARGTRAGTAAATAIGTGTGPGTGTGTGTAVDEVNWIPTLPEELVGPFLDECQERIDGLSGRILRIEQEGPGVDGGEEMRALFRDLHTLKGSSGFAGLVRLNRLAHAAEDLIGKVRDGKAPCDRPVIDALLASLDRFRAIIERASVRAPIDVQVDDVIERLRHPSAYVPKVADRPSMASTPSMPPPGMGAPAGSAQPAPAASSGTLRVEFERVDQLQNFVNELVLARSRLTNATSKLGVARELSRMRRRVHGLALARNGNGTGHELERELSAIAEELGRTERVVDEGEVELEGSIASLALALGQLRDRVMKLRMIPIARLFTKHQRTVRELGQQLGKKVRLELVGEGTELDKVLVEQLEDPLIHLVRNAVDHGIETPEKRLAAGKPEMGTLTLRARQQGGAIVIEIADDGAGIDVERIRAKAVEKGVAAAEEVEALDDREALELVFRPGFSTAEKVTDVSGRGVGMDVVRESIARLKGTIAIHSVTSTGPGTASGTTFELRLPLTLAIAQVLLARVGGEEVAVPIDAVAHTLAVGIDDMGNEGGGSMDEIGGRPCYVRRDETGAPVHIPVVDLAATLGLDDQAGFDPARTREVGGSGHQGGHLVLLDAPLSGVPHVALACDALLGRHEVVVKPLGQLLTNAPCVAGASLMGDRVVLLLDVAAVVRRGLETTIRKRPLDGAAALTKTKRKEKKRARVLIAEDGDVVREGLRKALENIGLEVVAARDGQEALEHAKAGSFDLVSTDVMMPRLDGYGLTRALRALPAYHKTPIVMVTSRDQRVDVLRGYDAGVDAYVTKPADVNALLKTIEELLARRG